MNRKAPPRRDAPDCEHAHASAGRMLEALQSTNAARSLNAQALQSDSLSGVFCGFAKRLIEQG
ncbi:hypothetical protein [Rhodopseudomonas palustris]|uniref:hypothetical protein n=1 Tax=Rhodopseudomonas palustris TaxID=1076 RepID=UPI0011C498CB|nr:hypothetical protein [Rhodopseudomonas palustris]